MKATLFPPTNYCPQWIARPHDDNGSLTNHVLLVIDEDRPKAKGWRSLAPTTHEAEVYWAQSPVSCYVERIYGYTPPAEEKPTLMGIPVRQESLVKEDVIPKAELVEPPKPIDLLFSFDVDQYRIGAYFIIQTLQQLNHTYDRVELVSPEVATSASVVRFVNVRPKPDANKEV